MLWQNIILMSKQIIDNYNNEIVDIYHRENIFGLRGSNDDFMINGHQVLSWYYDVVRKGRVKYSQSFDFNKAFDELLILSEEIMFFLGNMYLYRPLMENPLRQGFRHGGKIIYPNYQNIYGRRYNMFIGVVSEKIYNYWGRIANLLAAYFPGLFKPRDIYFPGIIEKIGATYNKSENYIWLNSFKENQYIEFNARRKKYVHHHTHDTDFKYMHLNNIGNREALEDIVRERFELADYFKSHLSLAITGFVKTMLLIEDITIITIPEEI